MLYCQVKGDLMLSLIWQKDGQVVQNNYVMFLFNGSLFIFSVVKQDVGIFRCIVNNVVGFVSVIVVVVIYGEKIILF